MFRTRPVTTTIVTWTKTNPRKPSRPRKWIERAAWRFPNRRLYHLKWLSIAGDIARPVAPETDGVPEAGEGKPRGDVSGVISGGPVAVDCARRPRVNHLVGQTNPIRAWLGM